MRLSTDPKRKSLYLAIACLVLAILLSILLAATVHGQEQAPDCPTPTPRTTVTPTPTPGTTAIMLTSLGAISGITVLGNRGGCGRNNRNMRYGIICNVSDAGNGFVSGTCEGGYWFSRVPTARTFTSGQVITVNYGCEGLNRELYAPIRITK